MRCHRDVITGNRIVCGSIGIAHAFATANTVRVVVPTASSAIGPHHEPFRGRARAGGTRLDKAALGASFRRIVRHKGAAVAVFATARQLARLADAARSLGFTLTKDAAAG